MLEYWIWYENLKGVTRFQKRQLLQYFKTPYNIYKATLMDFPENLITREKFLAFNKQKQLDYSKSVIEKNSKFKIKCITSDDPNYREMGPYVVYYQGQLSNKSGTAVVGTRKCSGQGYYYTKIVCNDLIKKDRCINSGLALGIDYWAHHQALELGGETQAFMAHGLDCCYPKENRSMLERIRLDGAVLSPFAVGEKPLGYRFLVRNQLMSLWSDEVVVIEAGAKSGALNTAKHARNQGKKIWTIKGPDNVPKCEGNKFLLGSGAFEYLNDEILEIKNDIKKDEVIEELISAPMSMEDLLEKLNWNYDILEEWLLSLELRHWLVFKGDGRWHFNGW